MKSFVKDALELPPPGYIWLMTSKGCLTVVVCVAELLPELESKVLELTDAVLEIVVPSVTEAPTLTTSVKTADPAANDEFVQLIEPVPPTDGVVGQVHPLGGAIDLKVVFVGTVSERTALTAVLGPPLVAV